MKHCAIILAFTAAVTALSLASCGSDDASENESSSAQITDNAADAAEESSQALDEADNSSQTDENASKTASDDTEGEIPEPIDEDPDGDIDECIEEEATNFETFDDEQDFAESDEIKYFCDVNGYDIENILPEFSEDYSFDGATTFEDAYYVTFTGSAGSYNICMTTNHYDSDEELWDSYVNYDGFSLSDKTYFDEDTRSVVDILGSDVMLARLTDDGFEYQIFSGGASEESLLNFAKQIEF